MNDIKALGVEPGDGLVVIEIDAISHERVGLHAAVVLRMWGAKMEVMMNGEKYFVGKCLKFYRPADAQNSRSFFEQFSIIDVVTT